MNVTHYKIEALIRPQRLEAVQDALYEIGAQGLTTMEVRGTGRQKGIAHTFRGSQYNSGLAPRISVEVVVAEEQLDETLGVIQEAASTGEVGDGKIFVTPLREVIRIRTGERGQAALD